MNKRFWIMNSAVMPNNGTYQITKHISPDKWITIYKNLIAQGYTVVSSMSYLENIKVIEDQYNIRLPLAKEQFTEEKPLTILDDESIFLVMTLKVRLPSDKKGINGNFTIDDYDFSIGFFKRTTSNDEIDNIIMEYSIDG